MMPCAASVECSACAAACHPRLRGVFLPDLVHRDDPELPKGCEEAFDVFCLLLRRFSHAYTALEQELNCAVFAAVTRLADGRNTKPLIAVLRGQRMSPLKDTIKRLMRATKASQRRRDHTDAVFSQLGEIQFFRDRLTHHFTAISADDPSKWVNMNFAGIREPHLMEDITFDLEALVAATHDLMEMRAMTGDMFNHHTRKGSAATPPLPAWRYNPSMLIRDRPLQKGNRARRKQPRRASRE